MICSPLNQQPLLLHRPPPPVILLVLFNTNLPIAISQLLSIYRPTSPPTIPLPVFARSEREVEVQLYRTLDSLNKLCTCYMLVFWKRQRNDTPS